MTASPTNATGDRARPARARRRGLRLATAAAAFVSAVLVAPAAAPAPPAAAADAPTIELAQPTTAVELNGTASFRFRVTGAPEDADIDLVVSTALDLAGVRRAEDGTLPNRQVGFLPRMPLAEVLQPDGTALLTFTVVGQAPQLDAEIRVPDPGIYAVRVRLLARRTTTELAHTIAFLERPRAGASLPLAVVVPASAAPASTPAGAGIPDAAVVRHLGDLARLLNDRPGLPITFAPRPETIEAVARTNRGLVDQLALATSRSNVQVLARPYVRVDVPALDAANLSGEVGSQLAVGESTVSTVLAGTSPDRRVWIADGPLDRDALTTLGRLGVRVVLFTPSQLEPSPDGPASRPTSLATGDASLALRAVVAEPSVVTLVPPKGVTDLVAAHRLVTELAVRALANEAGAGAVVVTDETGGLDVDYVKAIDDALRGTKLVAAVTFDDYLRRTVSNRDVTRTVAAAPQADLTAYARGLFVTRVAIDHLASTLPATTKLFDGLSTLLTLAGSADLDAATRQAYLDAANARLLPVRTAVSASARQQLTLAGREGTLPLVVRNEFDEPLAVRITIDSSKLTVTGNGRVVTVPAHGSTNVDVPVVARTSAWRFPVRVALTTPNGADTMAEPVVFDLRVVGLSGLGIGVSAAAGLVLLTWWFTHARSRRRAKRRGLGADDAGSRSGDTDEEPARANAE